MSLTLTASCFKPRFKNCKDAGLMLGQGITSSVVGHCLMVQSFVAARFVTTRSSKSYSIKEWECLPYW